MAILEALMMLWLKETVNSKAVAGAIQRMTTEHKLEESIPEGKNPESSLLVWTNACCKALGNRIFMETDSTQVVTRLLPSQFDLFLRSTQNFRDSLFACQRSAIFLTCPMVWDSPALRPSTFPMNWIGGR